MKQLFAISILMLTFACSKGQSCLNTGSERIFLVGTQLGVSEKGEFVTSLELSTFKSQPDFYLSLVGEFYSAKNRTWTSTTAQLGARVNKRFLGGSEAYRVIGFGGVKYATQGNEKENALNQVIYEVGVGGLRRLSSTEDADVWLRLNASYNSVPGNQFIGSIGLQFLF